MPTRVVETEADQVVHAQLAHVGERHIDCRSLSPRPQM
jgi:hypothetical protein